MKKDIKFSDIEEVVTTNVKHYGKKYNININHEFALTKFFEEAGELAQAILIHQHKSRPEKHLPPTESKKLVATELADVVGLAILIAQLYEIDLQSAMISKWDKQGKFAQNK